MKCETGYPVFTGTKTKAEELAALVSGLERNGFLKEYTDILTGYMSSTPFLEEFVTVVDRLLKANPRIFYCKSLLS
jgi:pyridoxal/pyridoxine/pyridoxamine kinase